jgi:hydrogenase-4 component F
LWLAGFLAITGTPPFGVFLSKFIILKAALGQGHYVLATLFLVVLAVIFIGLAKLCLPMAQGVPAQNIQPLRKTESRMSVFPAAVFLVIVFLLGVYIPPGLSDALTQASRMLGGN